MYLLTANWGLLENENDTSIFSIRDNLLNLKGEGVRECDSMSAAGAQIRRSLGHTVFQNGKSDMMTVFDIWLVESGYWSLIYVQEAFP